MVILLLFFYDGPYRQPWLQLGDKNTKIFYAYLKHQYANNSLHGLINSNGQSIVNSEALKILALEYFETIYNQSHYWNVFLR